jgi:hypothetical protein
MHMSEYIDVTTFVYVPEAFRPGVRRVHQHTTATAATRNGRTWKLRQMRSLSFTSVWRIGSHSWYARTAAHLRSVKHAPDAENLRRPRFSVRAGK